MKEKPFNLSEKIETQVFDNDKFTDGLYWHRDIKEFIRLLKEVLGGECDEEIDKLAGEKLI